TAPPSASRAAGSRRPSFRAVLLLRAAEALRDQLLRVLWFDAEVLGHFDDGAAVEVPEPEDLLAARREALQRFARGQLVGQAVEDAGRGGIDAIHLHRLELRGRNAPMRAPVVTAGVADRADEPR